LLISGNRKKITPWKVTVFESLGEKSSAVYCRSERMGEGERRNKIRESVEGAG
jgi:hypothetical protein